jgi:hypothetical protein
MKKRGKIHKKSKKKVKKTGYFIVIKGNFEGKTFWTSPKREKTRRTRGKEIGE